jgi:broad specificity phosphatase PhoE
MTRSLLLLALDGGAGAPGDFYVMRHLQRDPGPDPGLNEEGRRNAEALVDWFTKHPPPAAIHVSATRRARESAAPLAARLGLGMKEYSPFDLDGMIARARMERGPVLIVGHSDTVPEIVDRLGGTRPAAIADERYGEIWRVSGPTTSRFVLGH